jgi:hypothetical protein
VGEEEEDLARGSHSGSAGRKQSIRGLGIRVRVVTGTQ